MDDSIQQEILQEFLNECSDLQTRMDELLLNIEETLKKKKKIDPEAINELFRIAHTIKGSSSFLSFENLNRLMHSMESIMGEIRSNQQELSTSVLELFLNVSSRLRDILDHVVEVQNDELDVSDLLGQLEALQGEANEKPKKKAVKKKAAKKASAKKEKETKKQEKTVEDAFESTASKAETKVPEGLMSEDLTELKLSYEKAELFRLGFLMRKVNSLRGTKVHDDNALKILEEHLWNVQCNPESFDESIYREIKDRIQALIDGIDYAEPAEDKTEKNRETILQELMQMEMEPGLNLISFKFEIEAEVELKEIKLELILSKLKKVSDIITVFHSEDPTECENELSIELLLVSLLDIEPLLQLIQVEGVKDQRADLLKKELEKKHKEDRDEKKKKLEESSVRVDLKKLDLLMNLSGELVIAKSFYSRLVEKLRDIQTKLHEQCKVSSDRFNNVASEHREHGTLINQNLDSLLIEFDESTQQLSMVSNEIQNIVMKARMIPIGTILNKFRRMVRDVAKKCGKEINYEISGEETELDKKIVDGLGEPLTHLLRNSIDHGIESPEDRETIGKRRAGTISISAYNQGSSVCIEIRDDGKGMDKERILQKALDRNLIDKSQVVSMKDEEIMNLLFLPGFSTRDVATELSGRGVGMDVVKKMIEGVSGSLQIQTVKGHGSAITLNIPITLAIMQALLVKVRNNFYAFPLEHVVEVIKLNREKVVSLKARKTFRIRDDFYFLDEMNQTLGFGEDNLWTEDGTATVVLVNDEQDHFMGYLVSELVREEEIVIKSLKKVLGNIPGISGAAILGEGDISLILDVPYLIKKSLKVE